MSLFQKINLSFFSG